MNKLHFLPLLLICVFFSCAEKEGKVQKIASIGQPSEVVLVLSEGVQGTDVADSLQEILTANVPGLNQGEDFFRLNKIPSSLDKGEFYKLHSKLIVKLDKNVKEATMGTARDVHARPQIQVQLAAPNLDALRDYLSSHADQIRKVFLDAQLDMQASYLKKHHSQPLYTDLKAHLGYTIDAPEEIKFTKKGKDFLWASTRTSEKQLNMVFYTKPYAGESLADLDVLCNIRDSVMKVNIPGSAPDQWMETTREQEQPIAMLEPSSFNGQPASVMRGLWQERNGAMGGPFVSMCFIDSAANQLVVAEGFVFSPSTTKRDLIRRLEAALRTLRKSSNNKK